MAEIFEGFTVLIPSPSDTAVELTVDYEHWLLSLELLLQVDLRYHQLLAAECSHLGL